VDLLRQGGRLIALNGNPPAGFWLEKRFQPFSDAFSPLLSSCPFIIVLVAESCIGKCLTIPENVCKLGYNYP
jgi:hypothetical protein